MSVSASVDAGARWISLRAALYVAIEFQVIQCWFNFPITVSFSEYRFNKWVGMEKKMMFVGSRILSWERKLIWLFSVKIHEEKVRSATHLHWKEWEDGGRERGGITASKLTFHFSLSSLLFLFICLFPLTLLLIVRFYQKIVHVHASPILWISKLKKPDKQTQM